MRGEELLRQLGVVPLHELELSAAATAAAFGEGGDGQRGAGARQGNNGNNDNACYITRPSSIFADSHHDNDGENDQDAVWGGGGGDRSENFYEKLRGLEVTKDLENVVSFSSFHSFLPFEVRLRVCEESRWGWRMFVRLCLRGCLCEHECRTYIHVS